MLNRSTKQHHLLPKSYPIKSEHINGHEGFFITIYGRVFGPRYSNPLWERQRKIHHCKTMYTHPYYTIAIMGKWYKIHRLIALTFLKKPFPAADIVDHIDGHTLNNYVGNLRWVTQKVNLNNRHVPVKGYYTRHNKNGTTTYSVKGNYSHITFETPERAVECAKRVRDQRIEKVWDEFRNQKVLHDWFQKWRKRNEVKPSDSLKA